MIHAYHPCNNFAAVRAACKDKTCLYLNIKKSFIFSQIYNAYLTFL